MVRYNSTTNHQIKEISCGIKPGNVTIEVTQAFLESLGKWMLSILVSPSPRITSNGQRFGQIRQAQTSISQPQYVNDVQIFVSESPNDIPRRVSNEEIVIKSFKFEDLKQG